jgi:hypothetical protein
MKKILSFAVVCSLALVGVVFSSCKNDQKSSYQYTVQLAPVDQDPSLSMQFELYGLPIITGEMQKSSDQAGSIIFKDKRSDADKRAKAAFANGVTKVRKETNDSYKGLIVDLYLEDPKTQIERVTL